jgi:hypothetical protein
MPIIIVVMYFSLLLTSFRALNMTVYKERSVITFTIIRIDVNGLVVSILFILLPVTIKILIIT